MERKRRLRRVGLILILLGAGAVGLMIGAVVFFVNPDLIPLPTPATEPPPTLPPAITNTPASNWTVTFEYRFTTGTISTGRHTYRLVADCPGSDIGSWGGSFEVSGAAEEHRRRAYLRAGGLMNGSTGGDPLSRIHPDQTLGAALTFRYPTREAAEAARVDCEVTVRLDGGPDLPMDPGLPREQTAN